MALVLVNPTRPSPRVSAEPGSERGNRLARFFERPVIGVTVVREAGVWKALVSPTSARLAAAERVLPGGHRNVVSEGEAAELTAAGFEVVEVP